MKKRLIGLMLAGAMLTGVGTMTGCKNRIKESDVFDAETWNDIYETQIGKNLIVALTEKYVTLHKANVSTVIWGRGNNATHIFNKIEADCGLSVYSTNLTIYNNMPSQDKYDIVCETCFPNTK